ncbi:MAG: response regulator transcription factor [Armatimonadota bacterium]
MTVLLAAGDSDRSDELEDAVRSLDLRVRRTATGAEALRLQDRDTPALVIVATDLPDVHALDVCRRIRRDSDVPVIVLASEAGELDRVVALEVGADDVMTTACGVEELRERIRAALRRVAGAERADAGEEVLDFGEIAIDRSAKRLRVRGEERALTPMEAELLWALARRAGEVVASEELLESVWGYPRGVRTRTLDVHIGRVRKKLGEDGSAPRHIITVRSVGYRFEAAPGEHEGRSGQAA